MRVSIVTEDGIVAVDGQGFRVNCDWLDRDIHAIQWYDNFGEIEYRSRYLAKERRWDRKPNQHFTDFKPYQHLVDTWRTVKQIHDAEQTTLAKEEARKLRHIKWSETVLKDYQTIVGEYAHKD